MIDVMALKKADKKPLELSSIPPSKTLTMKVG